MTNVLQGEMATETLRLLVLGVLIVHVSSDIFDKILPDVSPCAEVCRNTYSPHTNDIKVNVSTVFFVVIVFFVCFFVVLLQLDVIE